VRALDSEGQSVLDVLYASRSVAQAAPVEKSAPKKKPAKRKARRADPDANPWAAPTPSEVVYLARPAEDEHQGNGSNGNGNGHADPDGPRWAGYTLDRPRPRLSTLDRRADEA
jgi:hypothetical protein